jgi:hypothetical protein
MPTFSKNPCGCKASISIKKGNPILQYLPCKASISIKKDICHFFAILASLLPQIYAIFLKYFLTKSKANPKRFGVSLVIKNLLLLTEK